MEAPDMTNSSATEAPPTQTPDTFRPVPPADGITLRRPELVTEDHCSKCGAMVTLGNVNGRAIPLEPVHTPRRWLLVQRGYDGSFAANSANATGWTGHRCPTKPSAEDAARAVKAERLARAIFVSGVKSYEMALTNDVAWEAAAAFAGVRSPSDKSRAMALALLERLEHGEAI
jgi:hypothetical protein